MRILFFVEPVIFRRDPVFLAPHLAWVHALARSSGAHADCGLVTSESLCAHWRSHFADQAAMRCFVVDGMGATARYGYRRLDYARALYGAPVPGSALQVALEDVRRQFEPELVVLTSQNAFASAAFSALPMLHLEQAPLPRLGQPLRMAVDPGGHQVGAVLGLHRDRILNFSLSGSERNSTLEVLDRWTDQMARNPANGPARNALMALTAGARVALLAMQPPDWVTFEGALGAADPEGLLVAWAEGLPPGWIAVPTYHPDWCLPSAMEAALARACPRLRFLPTGLSQGTTECLLPLADGLVTISSSAAMTAVLLGKQLAVVGSSPYQAWGCTTPAGLSDAPTVTRDQAAAALAFLCHRYSHSNARILSQPGYFLELARSIAAAPDPVQWLFDRDQFDVGRVAEQLVPAGSLS